MRVFLVGWLIAGLGMPVARAQPQAGDLVITEILFAPSPSSNEFIEILNVSDAPVDLQGVTVADGTLRPDPIASAPTPLAPGTRAVLVRDPAAFARAFPGVPFLVPGGWDALNNGGDLVLLQSGATVLDVVDYDGAWATRDDASIERIDPAAPSQAFNFAASVAPAGATPGAQNSVYAPDRVPPRLLFADAPRPGVVEVVWSEPVAPSSLPGARVAVNGRAVASVAVHSPRQLQLGLSDRSEAPRTVSVDGIADRTGNRATSATLPVAHPADSGDVVVTEILAAPRADDYDDRPNQPEFVEILNRSDRRLSLRGWHLTDRPREDGTADTVHASRLRALPPGGRAVIVAASELPEAAFAVLPAPTPPPPDADPATASLLARAFPTAPLGESTVVLVPVDAAALGLTNRSGVVRLHRSDGRLLDRVGYDEDWHAPALDDPTGTSLERIAAGGPSSVADNWSSSPAPEGATPGAQNAVAARTAAAIATEDGGVSGLTVTPSPFSVDRDGAARIRYRVEAAASVVRVRIYDARGRRVRTLTDARLSGATGELVWNGRGDDGERLRVGLYVVLLDAVDAAGGTVERHTRPVVLARPLR